MIRYSSEVTIDRPPRAVFDALVDPARYHEWTPMTDVAFRSAGPPGLGSRGTFRMAEGPIKGLLDMEIIEFEPGRRIVLQVTHPSLRWVATSTVEPHGDGARVTYSGELSFLGWRRILELVMQSEVRNGEAKEIARFRELMETSWMPVAQ